MTMDLIHLMHVNNSHAQVGVTTFHQCLQAPTPRRVSLKETGHPSAILVDATGQPDAQRGDGDTGFNQ